MMTKYLTESVVLINHLNICVSEPFPNTFSLSATLAVMLRILYMVMMYRKKVADLSIWVIEQAYVFIRELPLYFLMISIDFTNLF